MSDVNEPYKYALKLLSKKNYFEAELRRALGNRYADADLSEVIAVLKQDGYLDDARQLRSYVRWKTVSGYGPYYIVQKLRMKAMNVSVKDIYEIVESEEIDLAEVIRENVKKYIRTRKNKDTEAMIASLMSYLAYRGFASAESLNIVKSEVDKDESDLFEGC